MADFRQWRNVNHGFTRLEAWRKLCVDKSSYANKRTRLFIKLCCSVASFFPHPAANCDADSPAESCLIAACSSDTRGRLPLHDFERSQPLSDRRSERSSISMRRTGKRRHYSWIMARPCSTWIATSRASDPPPTRAPRTAAASRASQPMATRTCRSVAHTPLAGSKAIQPKRGM